MDRSAVITGITGQDGAYLAQLLLGKGYRVYGAYRRGHATSFWRLEQFGLVGQPGLHLVEHDLTDVNATISLLRQSGATEVYNLAAPSFVASSFDHPMNTAKTTGLGAVALLEAIRAVDSGIRYYQASTSEMFGNAGEAPQDEQTPFQPRSPYGAAKLYAHWMTVTYRESYGIFGASGILFNHESPLRGLEFLTRKVTDGFARMRLGRLDCLELGNLAARRDWGYAPEYVEGMWRMLQVDRPDTYVLATGRSLAVRDFVDMAASAAGFTLAWEGSGEREVGRDVRSGRTLVKVAQQYYRPPETHLLVGDATKARNLLGWVPATSVETMCRIMVEADIRRNEGGQGTP